MRGFVLLFTVMACLLALTWSAAVGQAEEETADTGAISLLDVDSGVEQNSEGVRQARQFGFYGRPYYGGYGGYRPYGGYYGRPYGGYYGRPYGGYYGRPYYGGGYPGFGFFG